MRTFDQVLELADSMNQDERENLIQILHARLRDERRTQLIADVEDARGELAAGLCEPTTVDEIMARIVA